MTIRNVFLLVCMAMVAVPVWAYDYSFRNDFGSPIIVEIETRAGGGPWAPAILMPGESHTFSTGGWCLDTLRVRFGGTINQKTEEMDGGEVLVTHPDFRVGKISTLPYRVIGFLCEGFKRVFKKDEWGAIVLSEDRAY